jgi:S-adenosylmethionine:tRNA ribosyltransferase-isomerase
MLKIPKINIEEYKYDLPDERIAQYPVNERGSSKLLLYNKGNISEDVFSNIANYLPGNSLLVFNNTRVIRARLLFRKATGAIIEIFCLEPVNPADYEKSFSSTGPVEWKCIIGNLKKWKDNEISLRFPFNGSEKELKAEKIMAAGEAWIIRFSWDDGKITFCDVTEAAGHIPLPPYVKREDESADDIRYQTVYSSIKGSVASPTAGLHFTRKIISSIHERGFRSVELTLHIGAGTFKPVRATDISKHEMHCEHFFITGNLIRDLLLYEGKTIAIGTTSVRTLESLYWLGAGLACKSANDNGLNVGQWDPYINVAEISFGDSMASLLGQMEKKGVDYLHGSTTLMIVPGYRFRVINGMVTNFHQPGSTLLLLVSAYTGNKWKDIYNYAMGNGYRFLSFGDTSLLIE